MIANSDVCHVQVISICLECLWELFRSSGTPADDAAVAVAEVDVTAAADTADVGEHQSLADIPCLALPTLVCSAPDTASKCDPGYPSLLQLAPRVCSLGSSLQL